jgi:hypothetical protein
MDTSNGWRRIIALGAAANGAFFLVGGAAGSVAAGAVWPSVAHSGDPWSGLWVIFVALAVGVLVGTAAAWVAVAHVARRLGNPRPVWCGFLTVIFGWLLSIGTVGAMVVGLPLVIALAAVLADSVTGSGPRWDRSRTRLVGATIAVPVAALIGVHFHEGLEERRRVAAVSDAVGPLWYPDGMDVPYVSGPYRGVDGDRVVRVAVETDTENWTIEHSRPPGSLGAGTQIATRDDGSPIVLIPGGRYHSEVATVVDGTRLSIEIYGNDDPLPAAAILRTAVPH